VVYLLTTLAVLGFYNASDDGAYLKWVRAFHVPDSAYRIALDQRVARLTLWLPPAIASRLGAPVYGSAIAWVLLTGTAVIAMMSYGWRKVFPLPVQVGAALLVACTPTFRLFSTAFYPDVPLVAFALGAFLLYRDALPAGLTVRRSFLIGLLIGLATLTKQSGFIFFLVIAVHQALLAARRGAILGSLRSLVPMALGGAVVVAFTLGFYWWLVGRPFLFFEITSKVHTLFPQNPAYEGNVGNPFTYLRHLNGVHYARIGIVLLAGTFLALFVSKAARLEAVVVIAYLTYLQFGSTSLTHYVPPSRHARYLIPCLPFMAVCTVSLAHGGWGRLRRLALLPPALARLLPRLGVGLAALLFTGMSLVTLEWTRPILPLNEQVRFIRSALREGNGPLYVSALTLGRWVAVLSEEEYRALRVLERDVQLPERYSLLVHVADVRTGTPAGDRVAEIIRGPYAFATPEISWRPWLPQRVTRRLRIERAPASGLCRLDVGPNITTPPAARPPRWLSEHPRRAAGAPPPEAGRGAAGD
jgi:hypothetical protein